MEDKEIPYFAEGSPRAHSWLMCCVYFRHSHAPTLDASNMDAVLYKLNTTEVYSLIDNGRCVVLSCAHCCLFLLPTMFFCFATGGAVGKSEFCPWRLGCSLFVRVIWRRNTNVSSFALFLNNYRTKNNKTIVLFF